MPETAAKIPLKRKVKKFILGLLPEAVHLAMARRRARLGELALGIPEIISFLVGKFGRDVQGGPFKGMHYVEASQGSTYVPKLIGCYEEELHDVLAEYRKKDYKLVVDIGSAEGYYAVGMATVSSAKVVAFEVDPVAQKLCRKLAKINGVENRVQVLKKCGIKSLLALEPLERTLVICDCEGMEYLFLDPAKVPWLQKADILVELHLANSWGDKESFLSRFEPTHEIRRISTRPRDPNAYPLLQGLSDKQREYAVGEFRSYPQEWAILNSRAESR